MGVAHLRVARGAFAAGQEDVPLNRLILIAWLLAPASAGAHEIGTTEVRVAFHADHTWSASIITGPQALLNKLEVETGQPRSSDLGADALRTALEHFRQTLAGYVDVRFDGVPSPVSVTIAAFDQPRDVSLPVSVELLATGSRERLSIIEVAAARAVRSASSTASRSVAGRV